METNGEEQIELLTVKDVAALLHLSVSSVRDLQARRQIAFIKVGGALRFEKRDVIEYIKQRRVAAMF
jgi:excisionase family DNA binding protein